MTFKQYLRDEFGSLSFYKKMFMAEPGNFRHDWIKFMNWQHYKYHRGGFSNSW